MKSFVRRCAIVTAIALVLSPLGFAQRGKAASEAPGIEVGEKAPDFSLKDQDGKETKLSDMLEDNKSVALVFYRSANW
jgi:cytochrome oxidase Cu insertion factor (SCO1/SenC/PrrC family)